MTHSENENFKINDKLFWPSSYSKIIKKRIFLKRIIHKVSTETLNNIEKECCEIYTKKFDAFTNLKKFIHISYSSSILIII